MVKSQKMPDDSPTGTMRPPRPRSARPPRPPSENSVRASKHFAARKRVRGEETHESGGFTITRPTHERWFVEHGECPGVKLTLPDADGARTVIVDMKRAFDARALARRYLTTKGVAFEYVTEAQVVRWHPNGELPRRVALVSAGERNEIVEELFDFDLPVG